MKTSILPRRTRRIASLLVAVTAIVLPGFGGDGTMGPGANGHKLGDATQGGPHGNNHDGNNPCKDCGDTDPVDLSSGELMFERTDLVLPGLLEPMQISFQYRSRRTYDGHWGFGWFFPFEMRLFPQTGGNVAWRIGKGEMKNFVRTGSSYTPPFDHHVTLTQTGGGGWELKEKGGYRYLYSPEGLLEQLIDRAGNAIQFAYHTNGSGAKVRMPIAGPNGEVVALDYRLSLVTGTLGKSVAFTYYGSGDGTKNGRLKNLTDDYGRVVSYNYDQYGNLTSVTSPSTTFQDVGGGMVTRGRVTTYTYSSGFRGGVSGSPVDPRDHNLLTVVDDRGLTQLVNRYDANDRVVEQDFNGSTTTIAYTVDANGKVTRADETDANGILHQRNYDANGNPTSVSYQALGIHTGVSGHQYTSYTYDSAQHVTQVAYPMGNGVEYTYDAQGNVLEERRKTNVFAANNAADIVRTFTYEPQFNQLKTETDEIGFTTTWFYDYEEATLGDLNGDGVTNQAAGNVVLVHHPDATLPDGITQSGIDIEYHYNAFGQLLGWTDPEGHEVERRYHPSGHSAFGRLAEQIVDPGGLALTTEFAYDGFGFLASVRDPRGNSTTFVSDALGELVDVQAAHGVRSRATYDANGNVVKSEIRNVGLSGVLTPEWIVSTQAFDAWNRMISRTQDVSASPAVTRTTSYEYDGLSGVTSVTSPEGRVVRIEYDELGVPWRTTRGHGTASAATETIHLDRNGRVVQSIDGLGQVTLCVYDLFDRPISATDAAGHKVEMDWNKRDEPVERRQFGPGNALAAKIGFAHDSLGRLIRSTEIDVSNSSSTSETWYEFDKASRLVELRTPRGYSTTFGYDAANRRTSSLDSIGNGLAWTYDANGNPVSVVSTEKVPGSSDEVHQTESAWDSLDRLIETRRIDRLTPSHEIVTAIAYDSRSNVVSVTDAVGRVTANAFDLASRVIESVEDDGGLAISTQYAWDKDDLLTSLIDSAGNTTTWTYDSRAQRTRATYPGGGFEAWTYDAAGNTVGARATDGTLTTLTYHANNLLKDRVNGAIAEEFTWTCFGAPASAKVSKAGVQQSSVSFTYDGFARLANEVQDGLTVQHGYDAGHVLTSLTYPDSFALTLAYDALDRLSTVADGGGTIASYTFSGRSRVKSRTTGLSQSNSWDGFKRLIGIQAGSAFDLAFAFDDVDRTTFKQRNHAAGIGDVYVHDGASRLSEVWYGASNPPAGNGGAVSHLSVVQNGAGDRTSVVLDGNTTTYNVPDTLHRYTQIGAATRSYDAKGNLIEDGTQGFEYDAWDRLVRVKDLSTGVDRARYEFDALGRRSKKFEAGLTTRYVYSGASLLAEYEDSGSGFVLKRRYVYGAGLDEVVCVDASGQRYFVYQDALGSVELVTDQSNNVVERYEYDAFGSPTVLDASGSPITGAYGRPASSIKNALWFTGARWDAESGQYHMRTRQYEPASGNFTSRDVLEYFDGPNPYTYAHGDTVDWVDPFGRNAEPGWFQSAYTDALNAICDSAPFELFARIHDGGEAAIAAVSDTYQPNYVSKEAHEAQKLLSQGANPWKIGAKYGFDSALKSADLIANGVPIMRGAGVALKGVGRGALWGASKLPAAGRLAAGFAEKSLAATALAARQAARMGGAAGRAALERARQQALRGMEALAARLGKLDPACRKLNQMFNRGFAGGPGALGRQIRNNGQVLDRVAPNKLVVTENHLEDLLGLFGKHNGKWNLPRKEFWQHVLPHKHLYELTHGPGSLNANWLKTFNKLGATKTTYWPWQL